MMRLALTGIALCFYAVVALAAGGFGVGNNLTGFWQKPTTAAVPTLTFVGCTADTTNLTTYTFTDHATGTAGTRKTIVTVGGKDSATSFSISSMTVGGAAATEVVETAHASSVAQTGIYIIDNPSGTTATIAVTWSEPITSATVCVWAAYNLNSETATATATDYVASGTLDLTLSLNVSADGFAIGATGSLNTGAYTWTWTGHTERRDAVFETSDGQHSTADSLTTGTPVTITVNGPGALNDEVVGATASFR